MNLKTLILTQNDCYKAGRKITPKGIMVHSTGANNPNLRRYVGPDDGLLGPNQYNNHWNTPTPGGRTVCVHAFIGKLLDGSIATYQTLPWNHRGWHGGSGPNGSVNDTHISFEICEDALTDAAYFGKVYQEAAELCAMLCKEYKLNPLGDGVIIGHYEGNRRGIASNHADPGHWFPKFGKSMDTFRADVKKLLDGGSAAPSPAQPTTPTTPSGQMYRVRKTWADSKTQTGAYTILANAKADADKNKAAGYKVFDESGAVVYDPNAAAAPPPPSPAPAPANAEAEIWQSLKEQGLNDYAIAGIMGNLYAESGLRANNLQNSFEAKLGYTDESYTAAVDNGTYTNFVKDSAGYGLAQWTYWSRKEALLNYARSMGASIGSLPMQLAFLWQELQGYHNVMLTLRAAKSVRQASDVVLLEYERPADQSEAARVKRATYGQGYYDKYAGQAPAPQPTPQPSPEFAPYTVKVTADTLNIRKGPGTNTAIVGAIMDKGVYTIVGEADGPGATKRWGKLKSGAGWISLDYTVRR